MKHLIIKGIGPDRPGIVSDISGMVTSNNGNIEESRMIRLGTEFSILMMISLPEKNQENLKHQLETIEGIKFYLTETHKMPSHEVANHVVRLNGADNEGVVHRFADLLTSMGISIIEIITDTENAPLTGSAIFRMSAKMHLNDRTKQKLEEKLEDLKKILDFEITLHQI